MPHRPLVLLAEDDPTFRDLVAALLTEAGFDVVQAVDGVELVERARLRPPALVVTDQHMPRMNGTEALARLRSDGLSCPALLVTSFADPDLQRTARALDCQVLDKPVDVGRLLGAIGALTR